MYNLIKSIVLRLVPQKWFSKYENLFRRIVSIFYIGNRYACNLCNYKLRKFAIINDGERICPRCGSLPRTRMLLFLLEVIINPENTTTLHFSPFKKLSELLCKELRSKYLTSDFENEFKANYAFDIQDIDLPTESTNYIICFHILEHIPDDKKAMQEMYRILSIGGMAIIQTPFKTGDIYEDPSITSRELRKYHFGQEDHVRVYSVIGLKTRLERIGFNVQVYSPKKSPLTNYYGLSLNPIFLATKQQ
jgi:SAM-dependent methyltransferase